MQADSQWRKVQVKLEGEDEYEALDKFDRLEVFQDHIRCAGHLGPFCLAVSLCRGH